MPSSTATLWEISVQTRPGFPDAQYARAKGELELLAHVVSEQFGQPLPGFSAEHGWLIEGPVERVEVERIAGEVLVDGVIETGTCRPLAEVRLPVTVVTVLRKPGVMDPPAESTRRAVAELGIHLDAVRTFQRYHFENASAELVAFLAPKVLANEAIEQIVLGDVQADHLGTGATYEFLKITVPLCDADDETLLRTSREGQLYLNLEEMQAIRQHFRALGRNPTDIELETIAQTWSEHCSHKTLRGPYEVDGQRSDRGLLKDTIMHATRKLNRDWCVSVFVDNAGVIRFDDAWNVCFKVETHNHPSAIEPYGGANTGIGGVIRDVLGTGLGAKPIANTDVFCVADPATPFEALPAGVLHPARVLRGVVAGVRDYGNRMGIPTVNGAVCFDARYIGNPLVFCGTIGLLPADKSFGAPQPGDLIVAIGGRTGRDGIHGATFSSGELTSESETVSGGAVQIGDPITEKKLLDVLLQARDQGLYRAITDCGAGGFSSAVGEMGAALGARVRLEAAPLKYAGLSYTEIWISEAQERMVLAVPPENWEALQRLAASEDVEAVVLGQFEPTGRLTLTYHGQVVGELAMAFLHEGRPAVCRSAHAPLPQPAVHVMPPNAQRHPGTILKRILASLDVCSKEWIIRQYDHEVQGRSVLKPLVGQADDGPSDAAVLTPVLGSTRGIAVACGLCPRYGALDPYRMAAGALDEAVRNVVAVGADPNQTALLDNFCWGNTERPEVFGSLCRAALACRDVALAYRTPFISGKDSLNNEFHTGTEQISIPPTLLISALAIVPDVRQCVTMDLKAPGNLLVLVGVTKEELGGSQFNLVTGATGGDVPGVEGEAGRRLFAAVHQAIRSGLVRSCHDLSEGGLAVAAAEMAFAGGLGASLRLDAVPALGNLDELILLFSESNTRLLVEVEPQNAAALAQALSGIPHACVGTVTREPRLIITDRTGRVIVDETSTELKEVWQKPLAW